MTRSGISESDLAAWEPVPRPEIGRTIRQLRKKRGWTQTQLAGKAGIRQATVSGIERGMRDPAYGTLIVIADALEVLVSVLLIIPIRK